MKRFLSSLMLLSLLCLSGCITLNVTTEINEDGSGVHKVVLAVDSMLYSPGMFDDTINEAVQAGAEVEDFVGGGRRGILVTYPFKNLKELSEGLEEAETPSGLFQIEARKKWGLLKNKYTINAIVDTGEFLSSDAAGLGMDRTTLAMVDFSYAVVMPGEIITHNGTLVGGNKIVWQINAASGQVYELRAESEVKNNLLIPALGLCGIVALLILLGGGGAAFLITQGGRKQRPKKLFCIKCGEANDPTAKFCLKCGTELQKQQ